LEMLRIGGSIKYMLFGKILMRLPTQETKYLKNHVDTFVGKLNRIIEEERDGLKQNNGEPKNILQIMIADNFEDEKIRGNIAILITAGHGTTFVSILGILYNLAAHPEIQEKLRKEVGTIKMNNELFENEQVKELEYLGYFLKENLRCSGPTTGLLIRETSEDVVINDYLLPKNTLVYCNMRSSYSYEDIWGDPENFRPERFEKLTPEQRDIFVPFSVGPHGCIGMNLTLAEQKVFTIRLLQKYSIELEPGSAWEWKLNSLIFAPNEEKLGFIFRPI